MEILSLEDKLETLVNKAIEQVTFLEKENERLQTENTGFKQQKELASKKLKAMLDIVAQLKNENKI